MVIKERDVPIKQMQNILRDDQSFKTQYENEKCINYLLVMVFLPGLLESSRSM